MRRRGEGRWKLAKWPSGALDTPDAQAWHDAVAVLRDQITQCEDLLLCAGGHCEKVGTICPPQKGGTGASSS